MSDEKENLTKHDYDGIQEFDNPLPDWWLWTFFGTIIFAFLYWIHYEFGGAPNQLAELKTDMAAIESLAKSNHREHGDGAESEEEFKKLLTNAQILAKGKEVYVGKCAACHGNDLQGLIGPNLVDDYWIHGKGKMTEIVDIVRKGVLDKGMPQWETMLKDDEVKAVVAFIYSMIGTKPANPKAPQGNKVADN